jgi:uncharacterized membrane protein
MEQTYKIALVVHILSGGIALFSGLIAIVVTKGKTLHQKTGITFFISMLSVCISAALISVIKNNNFLLHIAIFSFSLIYGGYRSIKNKKLYPSTLDWIILITTFLNSIIMVFSFKVVLVVFGLLSINLCLMDLRLFFKIMKNEEINKNEWLLRHIRCMLGAYIATFTAFLVVNVSLERFPWLPWLIPTFIGTPIIAYWTNKYTLKNKSQK